MDLRPGRRFSLDPEFTFHRRYESLRAFFVEARALAEVAARFGYKPTALNVMIRRFNPKGGGMRFGGLTPKFASGAFPPFRLERARGPTRPATL